MQKLQMHENKGSYVCGIFGHLFKNYMNALRDI
jgi:hypothetical protein